MRRQYLKTHPVKFVFNAPLLPRERRLVMPDASRSKARRAIEVAPPAAAVEPEGLGERAVGIVRFATKRAVYRCCEAARETLRQWRGSGSGAGEELV